MITGQRMWGGGCACVPLGTRGVRGWKLDWPMLSRLHHVTARLGPIYRFPGTASMCVHFHSRGISFRYAPERFRVRLYHDKCLAYRNTPFTPASSAVQGKMPKLSPYHQLPQTPHRLTRHYPLYNPGYHPNNEQLPVHAARCRHTDISRTIRSFAN